MAWRVVIGYDGSEAGEDAVAFGLTWCRSTGDVPVVATVYPEEHPLGAGRVDAEWAAYVRELGQETLDKAQAVASDAAIYRLVASTSAARGLADLAEDVDAAAVVVGGSRKDAGGRRRIGSVANRLLYGATVPVCVVPEAWQAPDSDLISKIAWHSSTPRTATRRSAPRSGRLAGSQLDSCCTALWLARQSITPSSRAAGTSRCFTTPPVPRTLRRWTTRLPGCRRSSSRRRSFSRAMWPSDWPNWGSTIWTCWCADPVAMVRSAGCCSVESRPAWSDARNCRSWSYHGPRRVLRQLRIDSGQRGHAWWAASCFWWPTGSSWNVQ
jgi:nucleotide-binding universal stress UspA family protein